MNNNISQNNTNMWNEYLSEMDKIFIPKDLDGNVDMDNLLSYKFNLKGFQTVPENYSLVTKNIFTQANKNVDGFGVKFFMPLFTKTILVPRYSGIKKYNDIETFSSDGEELKVDLDIVMRIVDPAKYMVEGKTKLAELNALVARLIRVYISKRKFDTVLRGVCKKTEFDTKAELSFFEERYGIRIERIIIEKVELSEKLKKLYNDAIEEKQRRIAQNERLMAEKEKAQNDAEISRINYETEAKRIQSLEEAKNNAYVDRISKLAIQLKKEGFSQESIDAYIKTMILADNGNTIFMGNNLEAQQIAGGIAGGQMAIDLQSGSKKTKSKK